MAIEQGWAIQSPQLIYLTTVRRTRSKAIDAFMSTRGKVWRYWQGKYHCRAVRVQVTDELWRGDVQPEKAGARLCCICRKTRFIPDDYDDHGGEDTCASCAEKVERGEA